MIVKRNVILFLSAVLMACPAFGVVKTWTNSLGNNLWARDNNWSPTGIPSAADTTDISNAAGVGFCRIGSQTAAVADVVRINPEGGTAAAGRLEIVSGGSLTANRMNVGAATGMTSDAIFDMTGGTVALNATDVGMHIGRTSGSRGRVNASAGTLTSAGAIYIGNGGVGSMYVSGTAQVRMTSAGQQIIVANQTGSSGYVQMDGGLLQADNQMIYLGMNGAATAVINAGTLKAGGAYNINLAQNTGSSANLTVSGGTVDAGGSFVAGVSGNSTVNVTSGLLKATALSAGYYAGSTTNNFTVGGGTVQAAAGMNFGESGKVNLTVNGGTVQTTNSGSQINFGLNSGSQAIVKVNGGMVQSAGAAVIGVSGAGDVEVKTSGTLKTATDLYLAHSGTGNGKLTVSGGTVDVGGAYIAGLNGVSNTTVGSGLLKTGGSVGIGWEAGSTNNQFVVNGGTVEANVNLHGGYKGKANITMNGGTIKTNTGQILLGQDTTGQATVTINGGTMQSALETIVGLSGAASVEVKTGGTLKSAAGRNINLGNNASGSGTVLINGGLVDAGAAFWVGVNGSGSATINSGVLKTGTGAVGLGWGAASLNNTLTVNGGQVQAGTSVFVGNSGKGVMLINGGSVSAVNDVIVGRFSGSNGTLTLNGGVVQASGNVIIGQAAVGIATVKANTSLIAGQNLNIGSDSGSSGSLTIDGGLASAGGTVNIGINGAASALFTNNGVLQFADYFMKPLADTVLIGGDFTYRCVATSGWTTIRDRILGYVHNGYIASADPSKVVGYTINNNPGEYAIYFSLVPEPATVLMLGLGVVFARKIRKA